MLRHNVTARRHVTSGSPAAAPALVGSAINSTSTTGTSLQVNLPPSRTVGNLLVMIIGWWSDFTPAGLSGWTQNLITSDTSSMRLAVYTRPIDGTESASYTVTGFAAADDPRMATVIQLSNQNGYNTGASVKTTDTSTSWAVVNSASTGPETLALRAVFSQTLTNTVTWTWSGTTTAVTDFLTAQAGGYYGHLAVVAQEVVAAGSSAAATITRSADTDSDNFATATFFIANAQGAPPPPTQPPTITSVSPSSGTAGITVSIIGTNFLSGATVDFSGTPATSVTIFNSTTISCVAPTHADGAVNVKVTTSAGASNVYVFTYSTPPPPSGTLTDLPPQPAAFVYNTSNSTVLQYAHPGGLVIAGRDNQNATEFHSVSAAGGTVLMYLECILQAGFGKYNGLLINASQFGPAVPLWPGPWGPLWDVYYLADFRVGSIFQSKLEGVMELMVSELPHMGGFFLDNLGTKAWSNNLDWDGAFGATNRAAWRAGAIQTAQTARKVCDRHGLMFVVNGTWEADPNGGGYPLSNQHGCSLADGGVVEHHGANELPYFGPYCAPTTQWANDSTVTRGTAFNMAIVYTDAERTAYGNSGSFAYIPEQSDYASAPVPWGSFHATGLPSHAT